MIGTGARPTHATPAFDLPIEDTGLDPLTRLGKVSVDHLPSSGSLSLKGIWVLLRRTFRYILPQWRHLLAFALLTGINGLVQLGGFFFVTDVLVNKVFLAQPLSALQAEWLLLDPAQYVSVESLSQPSRIVLRDIVLVIGASLFALAIVIALGLSYYLVWIMQRINQALRTDMIARLEVMSLSYHARAKVGDTIYRVYQDSAMVTNVVENMVIRPAVAFVTIVFNVIVITFFSPLLGLLCLLGALPVIATLAVFSPRIRRRSLFVRHTTSDLASGIQESFAGIRVIKAYGLESKILNQFNDQSSQALQAAFELRRSLAFMKMLVFFAVAAVIIAVEFAVAYWVVHERPTFGAGLFAFVSFAVWNLGAYQAVHDRALEASTDVQQLVSLWGTVQDMAMGLQRALEVLDLEPDIVEAENPRPMPPLGNGIEYENVSFSYDDTAQTLHDISLQIRPGTVTAVVGPTGAGKTTLLSLLLRLFDPDSGRVTIGGVDVKELEIASLRANVAIALQENLLFATTIRENIRYAVPNASKAQVDEAARIACADEFVANLAHGLDTELGERGGKLSTGQRQRLSIARAVIKNAPITILDEPTASLDAHTELEVLRNLRDWGHDRVIFMITHRLSTIRSADNIVVMDDGRIVEVGSHDELMRHSEGRYRQLVTSELARATEVA